MSAANVRYLEGRWTDKRIILQNADDSASSLMILDDAVKWWLGILAETSDEEKQQLDVVGMRDYIIKEAEERVAHYAGQIPAQVDPALVDAPRRPSLFTLSLRHMILNLALNGKEEWRPPVDAMAPHMVALLAEDAPYDSDDSVSLPPIEAIGWYTSAYGREAAQQACAAALERLDPKPAHPRNIVIWSCERNVGADWRADLAQWASKKDIAEFDKEWAGLLDAKLQAQQQAEQQ